VLSALEIPTTPIELPGVYDGEWKGSGEVFQSVCPATGEVLANVNSASPAELHGALERTREAYVYFRSIPAPKRGEIIRQIREALAAKVRRVTMEGVVTCHSPTHLHLVSTLFFAAR
jgi:aldehyde dehydrogenase family 7 protein A1